MWSRCTRPASRSTVADEVPFLPAVADALWRGRALQIRYRRWKAPTDVDRRLEPYGLVLKGGRWYLVAGPRPCTYRVDQILDLTELPDEFAIPGSFNLPAYWQAYKTEFLDHLHRSARKSKYSNPPNSVASWPPPPAPPPHCTLYEQRAGQRAGTMAEEHESGPGEPAPDELGAPASRPWWRRTPLIIGAGAVLLVGVVIAVVLTVATGPAAQSEEYTTVPAPCALVTATTLAAYMPGASADPQSLPTSSTRQLSGCEWASISDHQDRTLSVEVTIFSSASGVTSAQKVFSQGLRCTCRTGRGVSVTTQPVSHVGDQAAAMSIIGSSDEIAMEVRSGNAEITVDYFINPIGSAPPLPPKAVLLADATAVSRDVLAALANPAAAVPAPASTGSASTGSAATAPAPAQSPLYAVSDNICTLVTPTTLAKYLPGATQLPSTPMPTSLPSDQPKLHSCGWGTSDGVVLSLEVTTYSGGLQTAELGYEYDVQADGQGSTVAGSHTKVNGTQQVTGLGSAATAFFKTTTVPSLGDYATTHEVQLLTWTGNAQIEIDITYQNNPGPSGVPPQLPSHAAQVATATGLAHAVLTTLPRS